jgi:hypothetical protein
MSASSRACVADLFMRTACDNPYKNAVLRLCLHPNSTTILSPIRRVCTYVRRARGEQDSLDVNTTFDIVYRRALSGQWVALVFERTMQPAVVEGSKVEGRHSCGVEWKDEGGGRTRNGRDGGGVAGRGIAFRESVWASGWS